MNKQLIIQKLAFITEEMQQQTQEWQSNGFNITNLEVDAFISNIKYLIEQAEFLNDLLLETKEQPAVSSPQSIVNSPQSSVEEIPSKMDEVIAHVSELISDVEEEEPFEPYIKGVEQSAVDSTQSTVNSSQSVGDDVTPNAETENIAVGGKQYEEPVNHVPESTTNSQQPTTTNRTESTRINEQYKSEQDSLLERLKKLYSEKSLGEQLKEKNAAKDFSFSLNERFFIINQVFNGHNDTFEGMITSVKAFPTWAEAEQYLKSNYHQPYNWENKSAEVGHFFELMRERFNG